MEAQAYTTRSGVKRFRPVIENADSFRELSGEMTGWCLACGTEAYGVEPDARRYTCESCGAPFVFGLEELLMMGLVKLAA